jgi:hypothetical protein
MIDPVVKIADIRVALNGQCCTRGIRAWFKLHGFNYGHFLDNGIPASQLEATGDSFGVRVAKHMKEKANGR